MEDDAYIDDRSDWSEFENNSLIDYPQYEAASNDSLTNHDFSLSSTQLLLLNKKIHESFKTTVFKSMVAINFFLERFSISKIATTQVLKLLHFLFPNNNIPKTEAKFSKLIKTRNNIITRNYNACDSFTSCDLTSQISNFIKQYNTEIIEVNNSQYVDIMESNYYKLLEFHQKQPSLNLMILSDGISICKSTTNHTWPVTFSLIEVPHLLKTSIKNCFISGSLFISQYSNNLFFS
jgi:hypothetical protein